MFITFHRNSRIRTWLTNKGKVRTEEVLDIFIDGKKLPRGMCLSMFIKFTGIKFKKDETKQFILEELNGQKEAVYIRGIKWIKRNQLLRSQ